MSVEELIEEEEECRQRVLANTKRSRDVMEHLNVSRRDFEAVHEKLARARAILVDWETFFSLARNTNNWEQIVVENALEDCQMCRNGSECYYLKTDSIRRLRDLKAFYRFETADDVFAGSFTLCDRCVDEESNDYLDWWLQDMADDWDRWRSGESDLLIDPEALSDEGKRKIGYKPPEKKTKSN